MKPQSRLAKQWPLIDNRNNKQLKVESDETALEISKAMAIEWIEKQLTVESDETALECDETAIEISFEKQSITIDW